MRARWSDAGWVASLLVLLAAGAGVQHLVEGALPLGTELAGGDALFWGGRAVELRHGVLVPGRPPFYPALWALASLAKAVSIPDGGVIVARLAGVLLAPALAVACAPVAGRFGAFCAGLAVLTLPDLAGSAVRSEPNTAFALLLVLTVGAAHRASGVGWAVVTGLSGAALVLTKENGLPYVALLVIGLATDRSRRVALVTLACAVVPVAAWLGYERHLGESTLRTKMVLPFEDVQAWFTRGVVPRPLLGVPGGLETPPSLAHPELLVGAGFGTRALWLEEALVQRAFGYVGLWIPVLLVALAVVVLFSPMRRRGVLLLPALGLLVPFLVPIQARHAELAVVGALPLFAAALGRISAWRRGVAVFLAIGVLGAAADQGAIIARRTVFPAILVELRKNYALRREVRAATELLALHRDLRMCALDEEIVFLSGRPGYCPGPPPAVPFLVTGDPSWLKLCLERHPGAGEVLVETRRTAVLQVKDPSVADTILLRTCVSAEEVERSFGGGRR